MQILALRCQSFASKDLFQKNVKPSIITESETSGKSIKPSIKGLLKIKKNVNDDKINRNTNTSGLLSYCLGSCCRHIGSDVNAKQAHYVAATAVL